MPLVYTPLLISIHSSGLYEAQWMPHVNAIAIADILKYTGSRMQELDQDARSHNETSRIHLMCQFDDKIDVHFVK